MENIITIILILSFIILGWDIYCLSHSNKIIKHAEKSNEYNEEYY